MQYGTLTADPMTLEDLKSGLYRIMSSTRNYHKLLRRKNDPKLCESALVYYAVSKLCSEQLLDHLNNNMGPVYCADGKCGDSEMLSRFMRLAETELLCTDELVPVLWKLPAVRVGYFLEDSMSFDDFVQETGVSMYMDIDGHVFCTKDYAIYKNSDLVKAGLKHIPDWAVPAILVCRRLVTHYDLRMNCVAHVLVQPFQDFWDESES